MNDESTPRPGLPPGALVSTGAGIGSTVGVVLAAVTGEWWLVGVVPGMFIGIFVVLEGLNQRRR